MQSRFESVAQKQAGQEEMIRQVANMFNDHVDKGNEVTLRKQLESEQALKKA